MRRMLELAMFLSIISLGAMAASFSFSNAGFVGDLRRGSAAGIDFTYSTQNLWAYYGFDYTTNLGQLPDKWSSNNLTPALGGLYLDTAQYITNRRATHVSSLLQATDSGNNQAQRMYDTAQNIFSNGMTMICWIYLTNSPSGAIISTLSSIDGCGWEIAETGSSNQWELIITTNSGGGAFRATNICNVTPKVWTPVVFAYARTNNTARFYIGTNFNFGQLPCPPMYYSALSSLNVGSRDDGGTTFNGNIDEMAIWSVPLTDMQITNLVNALPAGNTNLFLPPP